jgi:dienelactone hydrolase
MVVPIALLLTLIALVGDPAQRKPATLDPALAKKVSALADHWWAVRPPTRFVEWDAAARAALEKEARAIGSIPEGTTSAIVDLLWEPGKKASKAVRVEKQKLVMSTPYGDAWAYFSNGGKRPGLLIGLHGGGEDAGSADEPRSTYQQKGWMGIYPQGIELVHDTWNTVHGERFILTLIENAKLEYDVDPDRVYVMGFSMGGTGSWFFAGRHTDLFAGASPFSGVVMASPKAQLATKEEVRALQHGLVPNVRNLAMWYTIGLDDTNCMPGTYLYVADVLERLRKEDPGGYAKIHFTTIPGLAHAFPKRNAFPETLVWEYVTDPAPEATPKDKVRRYQKHLFHWLGCKDPVDQQVLRAQRLKNEITLSAKNRPAGAKGCVVYLNASMIDSASEVVVTFDGKELKREKPVPDVWTILSTLDDKLDRTLVFDRSIEL